MYDLWRKQMLCLLESHDMLGFIDGSTVLAPPKTDDHHKLLWKRSDALVQGWILGSLSEQIAMTLSHHLKSRQCQNMDVTDKDIWDQLQRMCLQQAHQSTDQTPLDIALSNPQSEAMCYYLLSELKASKTDLEQQGKSLFDNEEHLVNVISCGHFSLAKILIKEYDVLKSDAVLMAIVQHWPIDLNPRVIFDAMINVVWGKGLIIKLAERGRKFVFNSVKERAKGQHQATELLDIVCGLIKFSTHESSHQDFYTKPFLEAIRRDNYDFVEKVVFWFPRASMILDEDGHNVAQACWKNRAWKVLTLSVNIKTAKHWNLFQKIGNDPFGNTFLHFAARLAPTAKLDLISCPPFRLQSELRWFQRAKDLLCGSIMEKNCFGETPEMVFTTEHKELLTEAGNWMKNTANAYILTATLIITIVFAATITVPGGNTDKDGFPRFEDNPIFIVFAPSTAVSMATATMSLLLFLSIMTSRFAEEDFKFKLPLMLGIGLGNLFISVTFMILAFGAAWFLIFWKKHPWTLASIAVLMGQPIVFFYIYNSNLVTDMLTTRAPDLIMKADLFTLIRGQGWILI